MLIGELSRRTGFSHDTIRFYEKKGLISIDKKNRRENNYKEYSETVCQKLLLIKTVKELGFTLREINEFVSGWSREGASCDGLTHHLTEKISRIDEQIKLLSDVRQKVVRSLSSCRASECQFEKTVPSCLRK